MYAAFARVRHPYDAILGTTVPPPSIANCEPIHDGGSEAYTRSSRDSCSRTTPSASGASPSPGRSLPSNERLSSASLMPAREQRCAMQSCESKRPCLGIRTGSGGEGDPLGTDGDARVPSSALASVSVQAELSRNRRRDAWSWRSQLRWNWVTEKLPHTRPSFQANPV